VSGPTAALRLRAQVVAAVAAAAALAGCATGTDAVDQAAGGEFRFVAGTGAGQTIPAGERRAAPDVRGDLLGGGTLDVGSLRGKVVVLNFWASWCAPCRVEAPEFDQAYRATRARGVEFLGVDIKDDEQAARDFVANKKISYPSLYDPLGRVVLRFRDYPPNAIPSTIVLDRQGRVAAAYLTPLLREQIEPVVTRLAAEEP
jgi:thiol-disulfide isomerase/thioredoxin